MLAASDCVAPAEAVGCRNAEEEVVVVRMEGADERAAPPRAEVKPLEKMPCIAANNTKAREQPRPNPALQDEEGAGASACPAHLILVHVLGLAASPCQHPRRGVIGQTAAAGQATQMRRSAPRPASVPRPRGSSRPRPRAAPRPAAPLLPAVAAAPSAVVACETSEADDDDLQTTHTHTLSCLSLMSLMSLSLSQPSLSFSTTPTRWRPSLLLRLLPWPAASV